MDGCCYVPYKKVWTPPTGSSTTNWDAGSVAVEKKLKVAQGTGDVLGKKGIMKEWHCWGEPDETAVKGL
jgi:hypothetical protein